MGYNRRTADERRLEADKRADARQSRDRETLNQIEAEREAARARTARLKAARLAASSTPSNAGAHAAGK